MLWNKFVTFDLRAFFPDSDVINCREIIERYRCFMFIVEASKLDKKLGHRSNLTRF